MMNLLVVSTLEIQVPGAESVLC